jgi:hypothetical protein
MPGILTATRNSFASADDGGVTGAKADLYLGILGWLYDTNFFTVSTTANNMNFLAQHVSILINHFQVPYFLVEHFTLK